MGAMTILDGIPQALHRGEEELPFVDLGDGSTLQLLQVDLDAGLWVIRNKFRPGMQVQRHRHTGQVFAFTQSGAWKYAEYPEINRAGSYLFEPAGSIHTLTVLEDNPGETDVWFAIYGANLNLDARRQRRDGHRCQHGPRVLPGDVRGRRPPTPEHHRPLTILARVPAGARTPLKWLAGLAVAVVDLVSVAHQVVGDDHGSPTLDRYRIDLDVYRIGASVWRNGGDLYGTMRATRVGLSLPFTYPPIAAVFLAPLTFVPFAVATIGLTLLSIVVLVGVLAVFLRALGLPRRRLGWALAVVMPVALFIEPVQANLSFGQVNILLMLLVTLDCLLPRTRWPRGLLVGVAAATKLTPAVFILFFLVRRDRRSARNAVLSFLGTTAVGFVLAGSSSVKYWTGTVFDSGRIGGVGYVGNQSVQSVLARAGLHGAPATGLWILLSIGVVALAARSMLRAFDGGQAGPALVLNAFCVLLVSPISWTHHWVWIAPALLCLVALAWRSRALAPALIAAGGLVLFCVAPMWKLPLGSDRELDWSWGQQLIGSSYVWFGLGVLIYAAFSRRVWQDRRQPGAGSSGPSGPSPSVRWRNDSRASA